MKTIKRLPIKKLIANKSNPRTITKQKLEKLVNSLRNFPQMLELRPIVIESMENPVVLGGNMRLKALQQLGIEEVPVLTAEELTEDQRSEFIIKDNVGFGEWDWEALANEWDPIELEEWGLDIPEVEQITTLEAEEDDFEIPNKIETDIVLGDLFEIGDHRLICGDSTTTDTYEKLFKNKLADLVLTDPPYNVNYEGGTGLKIMNDKMDNSSFYQFLYDFYTALGSYTKKGGAWYVFHADIEGVNFRTAFENSGLLLKQCLVWVKSSLVMGRQDYQWKHEPCLYGWKEGAAHFFTEDRTKTTVIEDNIEINKLSKEEMKKMLKEILSDKNKTTILRADKPLKNGEHPTMKPILLLAPLIENSSRIGEIVADGFLGSGSTMVAAHQLQRKCYGVELDPMYCQVIVNRMRKLDPSLVIKKNGEVLHEEKN